MPLGAVSRRYETRADDHGSASSWEGPSRLSAALRRSTISTCSPDGLTRRVPRTRPTRASSGGWHNLKGEKLPKPKKKIGGAAGYCLSVLILVCLRLVCSYSGETPLTPSIRRGLIRRCDWFPRREARRDADDFEALKRLAVEYYFLEEDGLALKTIDRALAVKSDPGLLMLKGVILEWMGDLGGALAAVEEARWGPGPVLRRSAGRRSWPSNLGDMKKAHDYLSAAPGGRSGRPLSGKRWSGISLGTGENTRFPITILFSRVPAVSRGERLPYYLRRKQ